MMDNHVKQCVWNMDLTKRQPWIRLQIRPRNAQLNANKRQKIRDKPPPQSPTMPRLVPIVPVENIINNSNDAVKAFLLRKIQPVLNGNFDLISIRGYSFNLEDSVSRTILVLQKFGDSDVLIFALFVEEYRSSLQVPGRVIISQFGAPSFLRQFSDEFSAFHSELFAQLLLGYLEYANSLGLFDHLYISTVMLADSTAFSSNIDISGSTSNCSPIFTCQNPIRFTREWFESILDEASQQGAGYIISPGRFTVLSGRFCVTQFMSPREKLTVNLLDTFSPTSSGYEKKILRNPPAFVDFCRKFNLDFNSLQSASQSTAFIMQHNNTNK